MPLTAVVLAKGEITSIGRCLQTMARVLDGYLGLRYCLLYATHDVHVAVKMAEAARNRADGQER